MLALAGAAMLMAQSGTVQQAALWQRAKDSTSSRQDRAAKPATTSPAVEESKSGDGGVDEALRWERAKDRAAKRQMQKDTAGSSGPAVSKSTKK
jgi:hypothetical protein